MSHTTYEEWRAAYPDAATALEAMHTAQVGALTEETAGWSESRAQQQARFDIARGGAMSWRNNVGATPARCPDCNTPRQPVRYGLANDSARLNDKMKSSDLILAIPRVITPQDVGRTIAQFGSVEVKPPGWRYTGKGREVAQNNWLSLVSRLGGFAIFSTGSVTL